MRHPVLVLLAATLSLPAEAQVIDARGIHADGVRIDATGVHPGNASLTGRGIKSSSRGSRTINGNDAAHDVDCRGGALTINGNRNTITANDCASITLAGNHNRLRWHRSVGRTSVANVGNSNGIRRF